MIWLLMLMIAGSASAPTSDYYNDPFPAWVPNDVRPFVIKAQACAHFSGEEPYDADRKAFLDKALRETCTGLASQRRRLDRRYRGSAKIKRVIADAWGD